MSWNTIMEEKQFGGDKMEFLKIPNGITSVVLLDEAPVVRTRHWLPQANGGKGASVTCIGAGCPVCRANKAEYDLQKARGEKPKSKYNKSLSAALNVYVVNSPVADQVGKVMIMEKGATVFKPIGSHLEMGAFASTVGQEFAIKQVGSGLNTQYTVLHKAVRTPGIDDAKVQEAINNKFDLEPLKELLTADDINILLQGGTLTRNDDANETNSPFAASPATASDEDYGF